MIYYGVLDNNIITTKGAQRGEIRDGQIELTEEQFNTIQTPCNLNFEPVTLPEVEPTEEELRLMYETLVVSKIREQYSQDDENKVLREYLADNNNTDFEAYNAYVVECKAAAYLEVYGETETTETETEVI